MVCFIRIVKCVGLFACFLFSSITFASLPRLAIQELEIDTKLSAQESYVLKQLNWTQMLREAIIDARFFSVVSRDDAVMQVLLKERSLGESSIARAQAPEKLGVDIASYFLYSTLKQFEVHTSYEPMPMLSGMYERKDSIHMAFYIKVMDSGSNIVFEELVKRTKHYNSGEASEAQKQRNKTLHQASYQAEGRKAVRQVVDAIMAKVNPIVVLDVQAPVIILDRGKNNGFVKDSEVFVYGKAREVKHPTTGVIRRISGARKGKAKVIAVYEDMAEAKLIDGDIETVQPGDIIRLIQE